MNRVISLVIFSFVALLSPFCLAVNERQKCIDENLALLSECISKGDKEAEEQFSLILSAAPKKEFIQHFVFFKIVDKAFSFIEKNNIKKAKFIFNNPIIKEYFKKTPYINRHDANETIMVFDGALKKNSHLGILLLHSLGYLPGTKNGLKLFNFLSFLKKEKIVTNDLQLLIDDLFDNNHALMHSDHASFENLMNIVFSHSTIQDFIHEKPSISTSLNGLTLLDLAHMCNFSKDTCSLFNEVQSKQPVTIEGQEFRAHFVPLLGE